MHEIYFRLLFSFSYARERVEYKLSCNLFFNVYNENPLSDSSRLFDAPVSSLPGYSLRTRLIADHLSYPLVYASVFMFAPEARLITREPHNRSPPAPFTLAPSNISDACTSTRAAAVAPDVPRVSRFEGGCYRRKLILSLSYSHPSPNKFTLL